MTASFNKGATLIALRPFPAAGRSFAPGDLFPWRRLAIAERRVGQLIDQRRVGELTQETYEHALAQRDPGDVVPYGFTLDGLAHVGIDVPTVEPRPEPPAAVKAKSEDYETWEAHGELWVGGIKSGVVLTFDVFDAAMNRLNPGGRLRGQKQRDAFLATLDAAREQTGVAPAAEPDDSIPASAGLDTITGDGAGEALPELDLESAEGDASYGSA